MATTGTVTVLDREIKWSTSEAPSSEDNVLSIEDGTKWLILSRPDGSTILTDNERFLACFKIMMQQRPNLSR
jgi:hypothetical protein